VRDLTRLAGNAQWRQGDGAPPADRPDLYTAGGNTENRPFA